MGTHWAVSDKFRHYLIGSKCTVITDNSALSYLERKKTLTALEKKWVARLAPFDMTIKYRAGNLNGVADALPRKREVGVIEETDIKILYEDDLDVNEVMVMEGISDVELRKDQLADVKVREIIEGIERGGDMGYYRLRNEVLYKGRKDTEEVLVLLCNRVEEVLIGFHDNNGHQGIDRTVARVNLKYTWYGRHKSIRKYIKLTNLSGM